MKKVFQKRIFKNKQFGRVTVLADRHGRRMIARDICEALGNIDESISREILDPDSVAFEMLTGADGKEHETALFNIAGVRELVKSCHSPKADALLRWIARDVITVCDWRDMGEDASPQSVRFKKLIAKGETQARKALAYTHELEELVGISKLDADAMWKMGTYTGIAIANSEDMLLGKTDRGEGIIPISTRRATDGCVRLITMALADSKNIMPDSLGDYHWKLKKVRCCLRAAGRSFKDAQTELKESMARAEEEGAAPQ